MTFQTGPLSNLKIEKNRASEKNAIIKSFKDGWLKLTS